jgi:hypothetical protein
MYFCLCLNYKFRNDWVSCNENDSPITIRWLLCHQTTLWTLCIQSLLQRQLSLESVGNITD